MATRINYKFIAVVFMAVVTATGIIGALWILQTRSDAAHHVERAELAYAEGSYDRAAASYRRALRRDPANKEYMRRYEEALLKIRPQTLDEARERYHEWLGLYQHEAHHDQSNPEAHLRFIRKLYDNARLITAIGAGGQSEYWQQVDDAASDMLFHVSADHDKYSAGRLYRGIARIQLRSVMTDDELEDALDDLRAYVETNADDDRGHSALITGERLVARHLGVRLGSRQVEGRQQRVQEHIDRALEAVPDSPEIQLAYARHLQQQLSNQEAGRIDAQHADQFDRAIEDLAVSVKDSGDPILALEAAMLIAQTATPERLEMSISLLQQHLKDDPQALVHKFFLANFQARARNLDAAHEIARELMDAEPIGVRFVAQVQPAIRSMAASLIADVEFRRWSQATSDDARERALRDLDDIRAELERFSTDPDNDPFLIRAEAKSKLAHGDHRGAASLLERLIREGRADAEVFLQSSFALERIGEVGLAYERLLNMGDRMLAAAPPELLRQKARLELRIGRVDSAHDTIERMKAIYPEYEEIEVLEQAVQRAVSGDDVAGSDDPVREAIRSAEQYLLDGDIEAARGAVYALLGDEAHEDIRLHIAAAQIEINAGALEQARPFVERGLEIQPDNSRLRQIQARLETGDAVDAVQYFIERQHEDPEKRDLQLMLTYGAMAQQQWRTSAQLEAQNMHDEAAEAAELAERADVRAQQLLEKVRAEHGNDPRVIEHEFTAAVRDRDWNRANALLTRAEGAGIDEVDLSVYRGRLALERGEYADAVQAFRRTTQLAPFLADAWRGLALSYQRIGNSREALNAYEETYRINPNNQHGLRLYLGLLLEVGEEDRALQILRGAHSQIVRVPAFREVWLQLEAQHGELAVALNERQQLYQQNPDDRRNAMQLALLLAQSEPRREAILDDDGERRYSSRRWSIMSVREQQRIVREVKQEWQQEAHEIVDAILDSHGSDLEVIALKATLHRLEGQYERGKQLLLDLIDEEGASDQQVRNYLQLAQFQLEAGRPSDAARTASNAAQYQRSDQRDAERFFVGLLMSHNRHQQAIPYLERILEVNDAPQVRMQLIECHLNTGAVDQAEQQLDRLEEDMEPDFQMMLLRAAVHQARMGQHYLAGNDHEAERQREKIDHALGLAESMMPSNPLPHIQRARMLLSEHQHTGRQRLLNEAMSALSEADTARPGDHRTRVARIDVLRAMGNARGAIGEAERLVEQSPENFQYRQILIRLHREAGQAGRALEVTSAAASEFPHSPTWPRLRGELHQELGNLGDAARDYLAAYEISEDPTALRQCVQTLLEMEPVPFQQILGVLREHREAIDQNLALAGYYAYALNETGRKTQANRFMRDSFTRQRSRIEAGEQQPSAIHAWFQAFDPVFSKQTPQEAESTVLELAGNAPDPYIQYWISRFWRQSGPDGRSRAVELLTALTDEVAELGDDRFRVGVLFDLATVYYQMQNYRAAAEIYTEVLEIAPGNPLVMNNLAFILAEYLDRVDEGWRYAQQALEQAPEHSSVLDTAGWIQFKRGNYAEAETLLGRSIEAEETATNQLHMAHVLAETHREEKALERLQRANELQPEPETQEKIERLVDEIRTTAGNRE